MQTIYRILWDDVEVFRGHKSKVVRQLASRKLRDKWSQMHVERCRYEPDVEECPPTRWTGRQSATQFMQSQ